MTKIPRLCSLTSIKRAGCCRRHPDWTVQTNWGLILGTSPPVTAARTGCVPAPLQIVPSQSCPSRVRRVGLQPCHEEITIQNATSSCVWHGCKGAFPGRLPRIVTSYPPTLPSVSRECSLVCGVAGVSPIGGVGCPPEPLSRALPTGLNPVECNPPGSLIVGEQPATEHPIPVCRRHKRQNAAALPYLPNTEIESSDRCSGLS